MTQRLAAIIFLTAGLTSPLKSEQQVAQPARVAPAAEVPDCARITDLRHTSEVVGPSTTGRCHLVLVDEASRRSPRHVLTVICGVLRVRSRRVVEVSHFNFAKLRR